jgi:4-hydroxy-3-methylbut-2-enyl diphosphate reductase
MGLMNEAGPSHVGGADGRSQPAFRSPVVDEARQSGGVLALPGGRILLPKVFGFCRGVEQALEILDQAVRQHAGGVGRLFLLGQIIHNPWVNRYFQSRNVEILDPGQRDHPEKYISPADCAIIPAFGVPLEIERRIRRIGCEVVDTTCGNVRRLWRWAEQAANKGYALLIFGRALHDETVVTKSRLDAAGGKYVVAGDLEQVRAFAELITTERDAGSFAELFGPEQTNADGPAPFEHLAQVSQTTMLHDETLRAREILQDAMTRRFGEDELPRRLIFERTVCRATQDRQEAAVELCRAGSDLTIVVGGFTSSNTRHLFELARQYAPAYFIESSEGIASADRLETYDFDAGKAVVVRGWLPDRRPLDVAVLAGASSPEIVVGEVISKLAGFLS